MNSHYEALKKLFPVPELAGVLDDDLSLEGKYLDAADSTAATLLSEFYPDTADSTVQQQFFSMTDSTDLAGCLYTFGLLKQKTGLLNPEFFIDLCGRYSLDATVHEGMEDMFILAVSPNASHLPHAVYDTPHKWTWSIDTTGTIDSTQKQILQAKIIERAPAWTAVSFTGSLS